MIETISLILFISAILFVALMSPKPSDKSKERSGKNPQPPDQGTAPGGGEKRGGEENKGPDLPGE
ncbi:MAG: hypothetical protein ACLPV2_18360 [Steroidobacteraceae bacterium]